MTRPRWLPRFPNHARARRLAEVDATIAEEEFVRRFVLPHVPCVIRGGALHWPAVTRWNIDVLRSAIGDMPIGAGGWPFRLEPIALYSLDMIFDIEPAGAEPMTFGRFLEHVASMEHPYVQLNSEPMGTFNALAGDLGTFSFIDLDRHPARFYSDRMFLSRSGYTDWHAHTADETITVQLCGPKEILMLPPDPITFAALFPMARRGVWRTPAEYWSEEFAALVPFRITLAPGDAIYIPMHWWHAAESPDDAFNATAAKVFRTPLRWLGELRLPNARLAVWANTAIAALGSYAARDAGPLVDALRLAAMTVGTFPVALATRNTLAWKTPEDARHKSRRDRIIKQSLP